MRGDGIIYKVELVVVYLAVGWRRPAKAAVLFGWRARIRKKAPELCDEI